MIKYPKMRTAENAQVRERIGREAGKAGGPTEGPARPREKESDGLNPSPNMLGRPYSKVSQQRGPFPSRIPCVWNVSARRKLWETWLRGKYCVEFLSLSSQSFTLGVLEICQAHPHHCRILQVANSGGWHRSYVCPFFPSKEMLTINC